MRVMKWSERGIAEQQYGEKRGKREKKLINGDDDKIEMRRVEVNE